MSKTMVVGHGPAALRAAAVAGASHTVLLSELPDAALVEGAGWFEQGPGADRVRDLYGATPALDGAAAGRALLSGGELHALPLAPREVLRLFGTDRLVETVGGWARNRVRNSIKGVHTGGREERSYRDWVAHRFGEGAAGELFEPYAANRWGPPAEVSVSHARRSHGLPSRGSRHALGTDPAAGRATLEAAAGEVSFGEIVGLDLGDDGKLRAVRTAEGSLEVDAIWCACAPATVAGWLGKVLPSELGFDARWLTAKPHVAVELELDGADELPGELHVAERDAPAYRLTHTGRFPGGSARTVLAALSPSWASRVDEGLTVEVAAAVSRLGLGQARATGRASVIRDHHPDWTSRPWYPPHVRLAEHLAPLGIHLVGRAGTFRHIDVAQETAHLVGLAAGQDARELRRSLLDPPVNLLDEPAIGRFVER